MDAATRAHSAWQRGLILRRSGRLQAARDCFDQATVLAPQDPLYWINLARSEQQLGRLDQAIATARQAFALDRRSLIACHLLAEMNRVVHRENEMLEVLDQLDEGVVRDARWHLLRGIALLAVREVEAAAQSFLRALGDPAVDTDTRRDALGQLGHCFAQLRRHHDAGQCYRMIVDLDPLSLGNAVYAAHYSGWACDWAMLEQDIARIDDCLAALRAQPALDPAELVSPFCLLGLSDDPQLLKELAERSFGPATSKAGKAMARPTGPVPRPGGKLRIGWISADFHQHATSMLLVQVLEAFDRNRFELYFYSSGPDDGTAMRARVMAAAAQCHEVAQWSDAELAERIAEDQVGVLIDLKGFTLGSRFHAMARRPAPIQVAWLGYPGTSGADFIDYIVGDPVVTPLTAQPHYSECIAQMPHCYQPNDGGRSRPTHIDDRTDCGLPEGAFVFASFNQSYKIVPPVFEAWCRILAGKIGSVLWLLVPEPDVRDRLRHAAQGHGIAPDRLVFAPFVDIERHRARLPLADLFLDTFPCGGHTTASDALWAGVPVLTMIGETFASRVAASLVTTIGLPEMVCADLDGYIALALHLAGDPAALASVRQRLDDGRRQSPLFDGRRFARDFEQLLLRMVERQDAGLPPTALAAVVAAAGH